MDNTFEPNTNETEAAQPEAQASVNGPTQNDSTYHYAHPMQEPFDAHDSQQAQSSAPNYQNYAAPNYGAAPQYQPPKKPKKEHKPFHWSGGKVVALALSCAILGGCTGLGGALLANKMSRQNTTASTGSASSTILEGSRETTTIDVSHIDTGKLLTPAEVYAANVNSTVGITTSISTNYFGYQTTSAASGSGFILSKDGYILTNYHVIENSNSVTVTTYDGTQYDATIVGYDESNDIAVLKVDATDLTPVILGSSDSLHVGDNVIAIGNPLGELTFSLTSGVVSALDRQVTLSNNVSMKLIQTDCAINSGNSGGPLFNLYGEVVGITNAKYSSSSYSSEASIDNIGFAIPIDSVRSIVESIMEKGFISKPYIGVSVETVSDDAQRYGLPAGAAVQSVSDDSPAQAAGLQVNDIITKVNDTEITSSTDLVDAVHGAQVGDELTLSVYRQSSTVTLKVTVGEQVQSALANSDTQNSQTNQNNQGAQGGQSNDSNSQGNAQDGQNEQGSSGSFPWGWFFGY